MHSFFDVDIVFLEDPIPYFKLDTMLEMQSNAIEKEFDIMTDEFNSGFYYIKSNEKTIQMLEDVENLATTTPDIDDQLLWVQVFRKWVNRNNLILVDSFYKSAMTFKPWNPPSTILHNKKHVLIISGDPMNIIESLQFAKKKQRRRFYFSSLQSTRN